MKILIAAPIHRPVMVNVTASRVRVIYDLAKGMIERGHSVSIVGSGNSVVEGATIIPVIPNAINDMPPFENQLYAETAYLVALAKIIQREAHLFDVIHNHTYPEFINLLIEDSIKTPMVTTLHAPVTPELEHVLSHFPNANIVAQSESHRRKMKNICLPYIVSNGVDIDTFLFNKLSREYLLWIGRLGKAKNADGTFIDGKGAREAIAAAIASNQPLKMVGNIEDIEFYKKDIEPFLNDMIQWISPISSEQNLSQIEIADLMNGAKAVLITTKFEESFGLVAVEAMACGTPVISFDNGALRDTIIDGETGFLVRSDHGVQGLTNAINKIHSLTKNKYSNMQNKARENVVKNFSRKKMIDNYEALYLKLSKNQG